MVPGYPRVPKNLVGRSRPPTAVEPLQTRDVIGGLVGKGWRSTSAQIIMIRTGFRLVLLLVTILPGRAFLTSLPSHASESRIQVRSFALHRTRTALAFRTRFRRDVTNHNMADTSSALESSEPATNSVRSKIAKILHSSLRQELDQVDLAVQGTIPSWLKGSLIRNGPALFEVGDEEFEHLFDGQAMLHSFVIDGAASSSIKYSNKMLDSEHLRRHLDAGRIGVREFVSGPTGGFAERVAATKKHMLDPFDNANVCVANVGGKCLALTEAPFPVEFDPKTARTLGTPGFDSSIENGLLSTAHPITAANGDSYNIMTEIGFGLKDDSYVIYRVPAEGVNAEGQLKREMVCRVPATGGKAAYMHSFCLAEDLVVLMEFPLRFSVPQLLLDEARRALFGHQDIATSMFTWQPAKGTDFLVVRISTNEVVGRYHSPEPIFSYHPVNCAEDAEGRVHIDVTSYPREVVYPEFYLKRLRAASEMDWTFASDVRRYTVELGASEHDRQCGAAVSMRVLADQLCEFPRINNNFRSNLDYKYVYGTGPPSQDKEFWRPIVKVDLASGQTWLWEAPACAPGEPIFVPNPQASAEDDGVLLSVVLDGTTEAALLLGLDARSLQEVFRAPMPHHLPAGFHGEWFPA